MSSSAVLRSFFTLSGYLFPLDFCAVRAPWVMHAARLSPFYAMDGFPAPDANNRYAEASAMLADIAYPAVPNVATRLVEGEDRAH